MDKYSYIKIEPVDTLSSILRSASLFPFLIGVMNNSNILVTRVYDKIVVYNITTREFFTHTKETYKNIYAIPFVSFECKTNERFFFLKGEIALSDDISSEESFRAALFLNLDVEFDSGIINPKSIKTENIFYTSKKEPILDALSRA